MHFIGSGAIESANKTCIATKAQTSRYEMLKVACGRK